MLDTSLALLFHEIRHVGGEAEYAIFGSTALRLRGIIEREPDDIDGYRGVREVARSSMTCRCRKGAWNPSCQVHPPSRAILGAGYHALPKSKESSGQKKARRARP